MTATKSWGPTPTETVGTEVDYQVAAPLKREHPTGTERISLTKECGWKDGDRGGPAQTQNPLVRKRKTDLTLTGLLMEGLGKVLSAINASDCAFDLFAVDSACSRNPLRKH